MPNPYYENEHGALYQGDALAVLRELPDESVNCCVTSPPYWGLRDYGTAKWEGGNPSCQHTVSRKDADRKAVFNERVNRGDRTACLKCGARRIDEQIGLEETPEQYVAKMVEVFREVRRVLRDDGTLWVNLGDSYASSTGQKTITPQTAYKTGRAGGDPFAPPKKTLDYEECDAGLKDYGCLKPKDLIGIPWRTAFALQADGWYLRQDIIWHKPNPMPESVRDRCTKAHEYIFLLSKRARYYYDAAVIAEPSTEYERVLSGPVRFGGNKRCPDTRLQSGKEWKPTMGGGGTSLNGYNGNFKADGTLLTGPTRNKRDVWTVATQPFSEAHFATFPPALIEPCILAGCPKGGTVLDPFGGSGTTGLVAQMNYRQWVMIELNPKYCELAKRRVNGLIGVDAGQGHLFDAMQPPESVR